MVLSQELRFAAILMIPALSVTTIPTQRRQALTILIETYLKLDGNRNKLAALIDFLNRRERAHVRLSSAQNWPRIPLVSGKNHRRSINGIALDGGERLICLSKSKSRDPRLEMNVGGEF